MTIFRASHTLHAYPLYDIYPGYFSFVCFLLPIYAIRTDNAIKNHWNSSVKKKLDMYMASGLLSQFQGLPLVSQPNHSAASSSSKAQQNSEDDTVVVRDGVEAEEASECSQGSTFAGMSQSTNNTIGHYMGDCRALEESPSIPSSKDYRPTFPEASFATQEVPCELSERFLEHDFSIDWGNIEGKDWPLNPNELPDMSLLDLGQESPGLSLPSLSVQGNHGAVVPFPHESSAALGACTSMVNMVEGTTDTPNLIADPECRMVYPEADHDGCHQSENVNSDIDGPTESLLRHSSRFQITEDGTFASQSCYTQSDMLVNSFTQSHPFPTEVPTLDGPLMFNINPNEYNYSHENAEQDSVQPSMHDGFIYPRESYRSPCEDKSNEVKVSPKLVPANDFVLAPPNDYQCCSSKDKEIKTDKENDPGSLFYEPPRFPSLDIPFFSCDLIQSGTDMHQDYSPLGIRQLMISSMTPFKLWDSPSRDDSPDAVLKSAAKTFTGTPSILKKRHRDLVSPLSEKRGEKKLEASCLKQGSFSSMTNDLSRLEFMFDECIEKENANPFCGHAENESNGSMGISESKLPPKEFNGMECLDKTTEPGVTDVGTRGGGNDAMDTVSSLKFFVSTALYRTFGICENYQCK